MTDADIRELTDELVAIAKAYGQTQASVLRARIGRAIEEHQERVRQRHQPHYPWGQMDMELD